MKFNNFVFILIILLSHSFMQADDNNKATEKEFQIRTQAHELFEKGKVVEAIQVIDEFEKASKANMHFSMYEYRASLYAQQSQYDKAVRDYLKAYRIQKSRENISGLAYSYLLSGDAINAETLFREGLISFEDSLYFKKGLLQSLFAQERYKEAAALVESLILQKPTDPDLLSLSAQTYRLLGENDKAWENLKLLQYQNKAGKKELEILIDIALEKKLLTLADGFAEAILQNSETPSYARLHNLIVMLLQNEQTEKAEKWVRIAIKNKQSEQLLIYLADALRVKDTNKSLSTLKEIKDPEVMNGRYYLVLGDVTLRSGDTAKAKSIFREAASFNDARKTALWQLFSIARNEKNKSECLRILQDLSEADPDNSAIAKFQEYYRNQ